MYRRKIYKIKIINNQILIKKLKIIKDFMSNLSWLIRLYHEAKNLCE